MTCYSTGMLYGEADALNSSYHISYNMLLNMLRVEDADPDFLVKSSFHQFQQEAAAPALEVTIFVNYKPLHGAWTCCTKHVVLVV